MESSNIYLFMFLVFGLSALVYGVYAAYVAYKEAREANSRPDFDSDANMFHFRRPEMAVKFEKEWAQILASGKKVDAAKTKEMMTKLVNRALVDLPALRQASSLFNASQSLHSLYCVGDNTKAHIDKMKRDADAEFAQVNLRAKQLRYEGNIFQMAAKIEAHQKQKFMEEMRKKQMAAMQQAQMRQQQQMKQMQLAKAEQERRAQQKRYENYLKQVTREEEEQKKKGGGGDDAKFKGLSKGFLKKNK